MPPEPRAKVVAVIGVLAGDGSVHILMAEHRSKPPSTEGDHDLSFFSGSPKVRTKHMPPDGPAKEDLLRKELQRELKEELGWPGRHLDLAEHQQRHLCKFGCSYASAPSRGGTSSPGAPPRQVQYQWHYFFVNGTSWLLNVTKTSPFDCGNGDPVRLAMHHFEALLNDPVCSPRCHKELHGVRFVPFVDLVRLKGLPGVAGSGSPYPVWTPHAEYIDIRQSSDARPTFRDYFGNLGRQKGRNNYSLLRPPTPSPSLSCAEDSSPPPFPPISFSCSSRFAV